MASQAASSSMPFLSGPSDTSSSSHLRRDPKVIASYPLTHSQEGIFIEYSLDPSRTQYNLTLQCRFTDVDLGKVISAINRLTVRHALLRSTFAVTAQGARTQEHDPSSATPHIDLLPAPSPSVSAVVRRPFDLAAEYPVRFVVVYDSVKRDADVYVVGHHVAVDGKSMSVLSTEMGELVHGDIGAQLSDKGNAPFGLAHMYERAWEETADGQEAKSFWLKQVEGSVKPQWTKTATPSSVARSLGSETYREIQTWRLFTKAELSAWGNAYRTSWFRVAVSIIGLVAHKRSIPRFPNDLTVSVAFAGRPAGFENTIGQFANALPIKIPISESRDFASLVKGVSKSVSAAKKYERLSMSQVSRTARKAGYMTFEPPKVAVTLSPRLGRPQDILYPVEGVWDLFFCFLEEENGANLGVIYDPLTFNAKMMDELKEECLDLIIKSWEGPQAVALATASPLSKGDEVIPATFLEQFSHVVDQYPGIPALLSAEAGQSMSYKDLDLSSTIKAKFLRSKGLKDGDVVLLHLSKGFNVMEWIVASFKAGATYAYVDPSVPESRKQYIVENAKPFVVVSNDEKPSESFKDVVVVPSDLSDQSLDEVAQLSLPEIDRHTCAYIIFTSGSTGNPKPVMISHDNLAYFIRGARAAFTAVGAGTRVLQFASFSFDASVLEYSSALSIGATLCFPQGPVIGESLADAIDANEVNFMQITPSALATLPEDRKVVSLRQVSVGGEASSEGFLETLRKKVDVVNSYGPTEAAIAVSYQAHPKNSKNNLKSLGKPPKGTTIFICNDEFTRVEPANVEGEVCVAGPQVGMGYKGNEELTAKRFPLLPGHKDVRVYRTGDRGKLEADGTLTLQGRMDREVKIRGYRIAPEEVENALLRCKSSKITAASVHASKELSLMAFVAPKIQNIPGLLQELKGLLPAYMVPSEIVPLNELLTNVSDKVDHKQMALLVHKHKVALTPVVSAPAPAPRQVVRNVPASNIGDVESKLEAEWLSLLGVSKIERSTNFFDAGGNSLQVPQLLTRIRKVFPGSNLKTLDLFQASTIRSQAKLIAPSTAVTQTQAGPSFVTQPVTQTPVQQTVTIEASVAVENELAEIWSQILGTKVSSRNSNFFDVGGHSLAVPKLQSEIKKRWPSASLSLLDLFHKSTIQEQAKLIGGNALAVQSSIPAAVPQSSVAFAGMTALDAFEHHHHTRTHNQGIAIVGLAGKFPGAESAEAFYDLLYSRGSGISPATSAPSRPPCDDSAIWVPAAGALSDPELFDAGMFNLSREEAMDMDPQQRLFLEIALQALDDAHLDTRGKTSGKNNVGLFVGCPAGSYHLFTKPCYGDAFQRSNRGFIAPSISARTAYHLNLHGSNVTINTNCASGTVALSQAVDSLRLGRCDAAVVGGVSVQLYEGGYYTQKGQIFSPTGECRPFCESADGTVPADGVVALVLKREEDAIRDGDAVYAVVRGVGIGSDGGLDKAGYQVPSPSGQSEVIKKAWKDSGLDSEKLAYVEVHGSGTPIGDALELQGVCLGLKESTLSSSPDFSFTIGSNKGNTGNTQHCSGLVSIVKVCKSVQRGIAPPLYHPVTPETINPLIEVPSKVKFASEPIALPSDAVLAVNASGWGGVNSHCVLTSPDSRMIKRTSEDEAHPKRVFHRELLRAPRLNEEDAPVAVDIPKITTSDIDTSSIDEVSSINSDVSIVQEIVKLSEKILGNSVSATTNLRDAGLDSNGFLQLCSMVRKRLGGTTVSVSAFVSSNCTPALIAEHCHTQPSSPQNGPASLLTVVRESANAKSTTVLIPPAGGSCSTFADLIDSLPTTTAIVIFDRLESSLPNSSIQDIASSYISELTSHTSNQLHLIGASMGGFIAYEIASLLPSKVASLTMIDSPAPFSRATIPAKSLGETRTHSPASYVSTNGFASHSAQTPGTDYDEVNASQDLCVKEVYERLSVVFGNDVEALKNYRPSESEELKSRGNGLTYVLADNAREDTEARVDEWKELLPNIHVEKVEGTHEGSWKGANAKTVAGLVV